MIDGHFDGFTDAELIFHHFFEGELFHLFVLPPGGEPVAEAECGRHHHGLLELPLLGVLLVLFVAPDDEVVVLLQVEPCEICGEEGGFCAGSAGDGRVGGLLIGGDFGLGGDVVLEVGPDCLLVVELVDDFSGFLDGLDDELDLVVEVVDLLDLYLQHVVLQDFFAALGVLPDALLQLHQLQLRLHKALNPNGVVLEAGQLELQFLIFLAEENHLFSQRNVLFHFVVDAGMQFFVLPAVDAVVLYQHEHVPPSVLLILLQLLIFRLDALELVDVLAFDAH